VARFTESTAALLVMNMVKGRNEQLKLFDVEPGLVPLRFKPLREKVWTESKAKIY
jgi:hypothetical protein